ncbi:MAG: hypothetical protein ACXWR1_17330 [Bdellovibrionota bacterium]
MILGLLFMVSLNGFWSQGCQHGYSREEKFDGAAAVYSERNYWDLECQRPAIETISRGLITPGEALPQPAGANRLDFTFTSVSLRPVDDQSAESWNQKVLCGFRDWRAGEEREVTGRQCDFFGLGSVVQVPRVGDRRFGIVKQDNDALFFGKLSPGHDGSSPERRPLELDPLPYLKR